MVGQIAYDESIANGQQSHARVADVDQMTVQTIDVTMLAMNLEATLGLVQKVQSQLVARGHDDAVDVEAIRHSFITFQHQCILFGVLHLAVVMENIVREIAELDLIVSVDQYDLTANTTQFKCNVNARTGRTDDGHLLPLERFGVTIIVTVKDVATILMQTIYFGPIRYRIAASANQENVETSSELKVIDKVAHFDLPLLIVLAS